MSDEAKADTSDRYDEGFQDGWNQAIAEFSHRDPPYSWYSGVYFIKRGQDVKIGYSHDVRARYFKVRDAAPGDCSPIGFIHCVSHGSAKLTESQMHDRFRDARIGRTEWFRVSDELLAFCHSECAPWPNPLQAGRA